MTKRRDLKVGISEQPVIDVLLRLWEEYKTTNRYKTILQDNKSASLGMGFLMGNTDIFTDFMEWLEKERKS